MYKLDEKDHVTAWAVCSNTDCKTKYKKDENGKRILNPLRDMKRLGCRTTKGCNSLLHVSKWCAEYAMRNAPTRERVCKEVLHYLELRGHKVDSNIPALYGGTKPEPEVVDLV